MGKLQIVRGAAVVGMIVAAGLSQVQAGQVVLSAVYQVAAGDSGADQPSGKTEQKRTPEQKFAARFPQPARVSHLVGLPVLDGDDSTLGYVQKVVKTPDGRIQLIVPYAQRFGWARDGGWLASGRRPVALPIEAVEILGLQINSVDMDRNMFAAAPTWNSGQSVQLSPDELVKIGIGRR